MSHIAVIGESVVFGDKIMYLIIDDGRSLGCQIIARTAQAGKDILYNFAGTFNSQGLPSIECLCIDYDLGTGENGYDVIKWAIEHNCLPNRIQVVTMNPVGRKNIVAALINADYVSFDNTNFKKNEVHNV